MSDEEIEALLVVLEKSRYSRVFTLPKVSLGATAASAPLMLIAQARIGFCIFSGVMALVAWISSREARGEWKNSQHNRALTLWREWMQSESFKEAGRGFEKTVQMRTNIVDIYENDPRGTTFPLKQAIRLINTYNQQQARLETVVNHVEGLRELRAQLLEKSAQLQKLGEKNQGAVTTLQQIESDIEPLQILFRQIEASCYRLELLLISVQKAQQIQQLHQEIEELASVVTPDEISLATELDASGELLDIERQITREVETFLQLERETDRHMREV